MNQNPFIRVAEPLAMNASARPLDVLKMKSALGVLGHYEAPEWGVTEFPDPALYSAIQSFQRGQRLTVDGVMKPGGPTEDALRNTLSAQQSNTALHTTAMALQGMGRNGDVILAHITPQEAQLLHRVTDGASINPATGLLEFWYDYEADAAGVGDTADNTGPDRDDGRDNDNGWNPNKGGQGSQASATTPNNAPATPPTPTTTPDQTPQKSRPVTVPDDDPSMLKKKGEDKVPDMLAESQKKPPQTVPEGDPKPEAPVSPAPVTTPNVGPSVTIDLPLTPEQADVLEKARRVGVNSDLLDLSAPLDRDLIKGLHDYDGKTPEEKKKVHALKAKVRQLAKTDPRYKALNESVKWSFARTRAYPGFQNHGYLSDDGLKSAQLGGLVGGIGFSKLGKIVKPLGWAGSYYGYAGRQAIEEEDYRKRLKKLEK